MPENKLIGLFDEEKQGNYTYEQVVVINGEKHCKNAIIIKQIHVFEVYLCSYKNSMISGKVTCFSFNFEFDTIEEK